MMRKSIRTLRKANKFLKELTDEEIAEIKTTSARYRDDEEFRILIDTEYKYRYEQKIA